jgi:hypothetical protein
VAVTGAQPEQNHAPGAPASFKEEFAWVPDHGECPSAYIECDMQTASQRQTYDHYADGKTARCFCALQRDMARTSGFMRRFIQSVERMQRADCKFGKSRVNQERELYL